MLACAAQNGRVLNFIKVARLQSEFCTKDFFRATNFVTKKAPKFSPKFLSLCSVGQKKSRKIPSKFPTIFSKFPCEKAKNNFTDELLQERREKFQDRAMRNACDSDSPLRFGLRCECPRCQIASDVGRAIRATKASLLFWISLLFACQKFREKLKGNN